MKKLCSLALAVALVLSLCAVPAFADDDAFQWECRVTKTSGGEIITNLSTLDAGDEVVVTVELTRVDGGTFTADTYNIWGLEIDINALGLAYAGSASAHGFTYTQNETTQNVAPTPYRNYASGLGVLKFIYSTLDPNTPFSVPRTVTVSATYTVADPQLAQAWTPNPLVYILGSYDSMAVETSAAVILNAGSGAFSGGGNTQQLNLYNGMAVNLADHSPTRSGYRLLGWSDGSTTYPAAGTYNVSGDRTLTAVWGGRITLNPNGGTLTTDPSGDYAEGTTVSLPTPSHDTLHRFEGWYTGVTGSDYLTGNYTVAGDQTLTAIWHSHTASTHTAYVYNAGLFTHQVQNVCDDDGHVNSESTAGCVGHDGSAVDQWFADSTQHFHWCDVCGTHDFGNHTYNSSGYCTVCNYYNADYNTSGGSGGGGGGAPVIIADEDVPLADVDSIIVTSLVDPTTGASVSGERDENGHIVVTVTDANGNVLDSVPGGVKVSFTIREGEVAILLDKDGNEIELLEKSVVEGQTAYVLVDGSCTIDIKYNALPFDDVMPYDWFNSAVVFASSHELFNGVAEGVFAPNAPMTRGMLVTVLWRLENKPDSSTTANFNDVMSGAWYTEAVEWASQHEIVGGYENGTYQPDRNISRQEMAAILYRYMKGLGYDVSNSGDLSRFEDGGDVSAWALDSMRWANGTGIITGKEGDRIDPLGNATRAEVATMLMRIVTEMVK